MVSQHRPINSVARLATPTACSGTSAGRHLSRDGSILAARRMKSMANSRHTITKFTEFKKAGSNARMWRYSWICSGLLICKSPTACITLTHDTRMLWTCVGLLLLSFVTY